jgi:hypothetical protein
MMPQQTLSNAIRDIRSYDAFVLIGAGASFQAGMPLAGQLAPLVWHTFDALENLHEQFCHIVGVPISYPKDVIRDDQERIRIAFRLITESPEAMVRFKNAFRELNQKRCLEKSQPHDAMARLIFAQKVAGVVSLNWDTLLESAFRNRYGFLPSLDQFPIWKPHGDCNQADHPWVLPSQPGYISDDILSSLSASAAARPHVLLIVGYSERDDEIVRKLIAPISVQWRIYRIGPDASGEGSISLDAGVALEEIANELLPLHEHSGWRCVSFDNQRGIEAAISGERLGPQDVNACPQLPHFDQALADLTSLNKVHVAGESGSGKSITIWQLAHHFHRQGWFVVQPDRSGTSDSERLEFVKLKRWPTVVVVDDTQFRDQSFIDELAQLPDGRTKLILGTTDNKWETDRVVRISSTASVKVLANNFLLRRDEILSVAKRYDSFLGDSYGRERIENRINDAASSTDKPWQFAYAIRGGWRQTRHLLSLARDFHRADLLVLAVAIRQVVSLDEGVALATLRDDVTSLGFPPDLVEEALSKLESNKVLLTGDRIRCLHLQSAKSILYRVFSVPDDKTFERSEFSLRTRDVDEVARIVSYTQSVLTDQQTPLRGISWLLGELRDFRTRILTEHVRTFLLDRSFKAVGHSARSDACRVPSILVAWKDICFSELIGTYGNLIKTWICEASTDDAYPLSGLMCNLANSEREACHAFFSDLDHHSLAGKLRRIEPESAYTWGEYFQMLAYISSKEWRKRFLECIPNDHIYSYISQIPANHLGRLSKFIEAMNWYCDDLSLRCVETVLATYQKAFAEDAYSAYLRTGDIEHGVLGNPLLGIGKTSDRQRKVCRKMFDAISPDRIVGQMLSCRYGDWEEYSRLLYWVRRVSPRKLGEIVGSMDWVKLDSVIGEKWNVPPRELRLLLSSFVISDSGEPIRSWVATHSNKIRVIDPILGGWSPEAAVNIFRNGGWIDLSAHNGSDWNTQAFCLARLASVDLEIARQVVHQNRDHLLHGIRELTLPDGLPALLELIEEILEGFVGELVGKLATEEVGEHWTRALKDHRKEDRLAARKVLGIVQRVNKSEIGDFAANLIRVIRYRSGRRK